MIPGATERTVTSGTVELAVAELGETEHPTILLVHGYPDTKEVWSDVAPRLAERFHVVAYDVRGAGQSTRPSKTAEYDLDRLVDDALAVLDATSPDRSAHLVGHDWGSVQGWEMATSPRMQGRLASFTTISGPALDHVGHWIRHRLARPTPRHLWQLLGQGRRSWYIPAGAMPFVADQAWRRVLAPHWGSLLTRFEGVPASAEHPAPTIADDAVWGERLYRRNVFRRVARPHRDATAHVPVQLVVPTHDRFLSPRLYDELDRWAPVLRRRWIDARHWVPRIQPDRLAAWIAEFVDDVEQGDPLGRAALTPPAERAARRFDRQLALVTGAGSGIGRATALALAEAGATVVVVDRDADGAERTVELAQLLGAQAFAYTVDVSDDDAMEDLAKAVLAEHGVVDVLVNNAGIGITGPFLETSAEDWRRTLDVNLLGVAHGCRVFGRQMVERGEGGHIVNVASAAAFQPAKGLPAYSTSKAAVLMLTECLRAEMRASGVGVTAVCPGFVATNITRSTKFVGTTATQQAARQDKATRLYRFRGYGPERVAAAILRAIRRNSAVVPITPEAALMRGLARVSPRLSRAIARIDLPV